MLTPAILGILSEAGSSTLVVGTGHIFWRVLMTATNGSASTYEMREIQMRDTPGGPNLAVGGIAYASAQQSSSYVADFAFHPTDTTTADSGHAWASGAVGTQWLAYRFSSNVDIVEIVIGAPRTDSITQCASNFSVQYSDDSTDGSNGTWTTLVAFTGKNKWILGRQMAYTAPLAWDAYWNSVTSLLHFDGGTTDEAGRSWTAGVSATVDLTQHKFGVGSLKLAGGVNSYLHSTAAPIAALGTGDRTVEFWIQGPGLPVGWYLFDTGTGNHVVMQINTAGRLAYYDPIANTGSTAYNNGPANTLSMNSTGWHHVAFSQNSGTVRAYFDGIQWGTATTTYNDTSQDYWLGIYGGGGSQYAFTGWMDEVRVTKGVGRYLTDFDPPAQAFPSVAKPTTSDSFYASVTSLLHYEGANASTVFFDQKGNTWTAVGAAIISTGRAKFGASSLLLNGTNAYASLPSNIGVNLGAASTTIWTIEGWIYLTALTSTNQHICCKDGAFGSSFPSYALYVKSTGVLGADIGTGNGTAAVQTITSTATISLNAWHHIALVRNGTTLSTYLDGVLVASAVITANIIDGGKPLLVGYQAGQPAGSFFTGNIDDFRITKGVARYTANFAPPTAQFPDS